MKRTTMAAERPRHWAGRARGGRLGNLFFARLARGRALALAPFFLFWVSLYFLAVSGAARRASFELADRVGQGGALWRRLGFAFRHFFTFGTLLVDRLAILGGNDHLYKVDVHVDDEIRTALRTGEGAILLTAHVGNWESMGHLLGARLNVPVSLVMYDGIQDAMRRTIEELARGRSFRVLYTDGSPASAASILTALSEGHVMGMMGDRLLAGKGIAVPFLGGAAEFPVGPFLLAASTGVILTYVFAVREGWRSYSLHGILAGRVALAERSRRPDELREWVGGFAAHLERFVRAYPTQWGNFYPFWKEA